MLDHNVKPGTKRVITHGVRDGVLKLVVIEDSTLRESRIRTNTSNTRGSASEQKLRRRNQLVGITIVEEHIEPAITKTKFVGCVRCKSACPVEVSILNQTGHINFSSLKLKRRKLWKLVGEGLIVRQITEGETVFRIGCPVYAK